MAILQPVFETLNDAGVRYVLVGGLAVVLHGHARLTADVDLVIDLEQAEAEKAIATLLGLGLESRLPVDAKGFANARTRGEWIADKGLRVFSLFDPREPMRIVDLFVTEPIPFEELWTRSLLMPLASTTVRVAGIADLIKLKRLAGRAKDLEDIEELTEIARRRGEPIE